MASESTTVEQELFGNNQTASLNDTEVPIVIPLGMYANYSKWIQKEITGASSYAKPILGVDPWAQQRSSSVVANAAKETVGWNSKSVVGGIWRLYRG